MIDPRKERGVSNKKAINSIEVCLSQASILSKKINLRPDICQIFKKLAKDETIGLIAYTIWHERSKIFYTLTCASDYQQSEANASRVSQAQSCWQIGSVAFSDLSR